MRETRKEKSKGITLIALVITIIVLLILAGVSISMLSGNNGVLQKATDAKEKSKAAELSDKKTTDDYTSMIEAYENNEKVTYTKSDLSFSIENGRLKRSSFLEVEPDQRPSGIFVIEEGVKEIDVSLFEGCSKITGVILPNSLTTIDEMAFQDCTNLKYIKIPYGVTKIGSNAFQWCTSLKEIIIPDSVTEVGEGVFFESGLQTLVISESITNLNRLCSMADKLTNVKLPTNLKSIGQYDFVGCASLKQITIPNSVETISDNAFQGCTDITINAPSTITGSPWGATLAK